MQHRHFHKIPSTQTYLRDHLEEFSDSEVLISCSEQTQGIGRTEKVWDFYPNSLAMSFLISPNPAPSLTSIEIGLLVRSFFKQHFNIELLLKWPNDLMIPDLKKCGGIISHYINNNQIIVGLGINFSSPTKIYPYRAGSISLERAFNPKELSFEIYQFILKNRIHLSDVITAQFTANCAHLNKNVSLIDGTSSYQGIFKGINKNGEALIEINGEIRIFLSGSLLLE